jgi:hypothetical protein
MGRDGNRPNKRELRPRMQGGGNSVAQSRQAPVESARRSAPRTPGPAVIAHNVPGARNAAGHIKVVRLRLAPATIPLTTPCSIELIAKDLTPSSRGWRDTPSAPWPYPSALTTATISTVGRARGLEVAGVTRDPLMRDHHVRKSSRRHLVILTVAERAWQGWRY